MVLRARRFLSKAVRMRLLSQRCSKTLSQSRRSYSEYSGIQVCEITDALLWTCAKT